MQRPNLSTSIAAPSSRFSEDPILLRLKHAILVLASAGLLVLAGCGGVEAGDDPGEPREAQMGPSEAVEVVGEVDPSSSLADVQLIRSEDVGPSYPNARIGFVSPEAGQRFTEDEAVEVSFSLSGYELGISTPEGDSRGIARASGGQHIHFIVNDRTYQAHYDAEEAIVLDDLPSGTHVLRAFPGRDWHESVKTPGALAQRLIVVGEDDADLPAPDEWGPGLIYSRPQGEYEGAAADSVLLDFVLTNTRLSPDGHRVRLTVGDTRQFIVNEWAPYLLVGLPEGTHTLQLELIDSDGMIVQAPFHPIEREIQIRP